MLPSSEVWSYVWRMPRSRAYQPALCAGSRTESVISTRPVISGIARSSQSRTGHLPQPPARGSVRPRRDEGAGHLVSSLRRERMPILQVAEDIRASPVVGLVRHARNDVD